MLSAEFDYKALIMYVYERLMGFTGINHPCFGRQGWLHHLDKQLIHVQCT